MKKLLLALYVALLLLLAATTLVEQARGTEFVTAHVYHTVWFCALWGALAALSVVAIVRSRLWRRLPVFLLHLSFLIILSGALTTFLCGHRGMVHLRTGRGVHTYLNEARTKLVRLPFTLRLDSFRIAYHAGTDAPSDYISYIHGEQPVSMNRILTKQGYRFYQSSYDDDLQGSWLAVNHDPWGIRLTYAGYLLLAVSMLLVASSQASSSQVKKHSTDYLTTDYLTQTTLLALLYQLFQFCRRWYVGGYAPLSNGYETIQFLALCGLLLACLLRKRLPVARLFGLLLFGMALLLSLFADSSVAPLPPVLASPLLFAHVSVIIMAYAMITFLMFCGVTALCRPRSALRLMRLSRKLLYPAVFLLGIGIFLGAVWANISWGRYWAWDPKEVWALVTFMVYAVAFHTRSLPRFRHPRFFHAYMVAAFLTVLMTYFGVNYLLGGMHSYA